MSLCFKNKTINKPVQFVMFLLCFCSVTLFPFTFILIYQILFFPSICFPQETCCRPLEHFATFLPPSANFLFLCRLCLSLQFTADGSPQRASWQFIEVSMGVTQIPNLPWPGPALWDRSSFTSTCTSWQLQSNQLRHSQNHQVCHGGPAVAALLA